MNRHLNDGQIRAALDHEVDEETLRHLESCPACRERQIQLAAQAHLAKGMLAFLSSPTANPGPAERMALARFYRQKINVKETSSMKKIFASPALKIGLTLLVLLALILAIPSTRALADRVLSLFRVQQVTVIPVDFTGLQNLTGNSALGKQISELLSSSINMSQKPGAPVIASSGTDASVKAGFTVRLPQAAAPSYISVDGGAAFTFKVDRARAQALLNEAGRSDLVLPASIDGADIAVNVPASVSAYFGTCPDPTATTNTANSPIDRGMNGRRYPDCQLLVQLPSPTVNAPSDIDIGQLAQIGLEFTGMTSDQAAAFTSSVDWTTSLVIPIPKNAATYTQVSVDGVSGTLIQRPPDDAPQFVLIWVKNGIVYALGGLGSDTTKALQLANSLP